MVTIGFDGSRLSLTEPTGTETYSAEILKALATAATDDHLIAYLNVPNWNSSRLPPNVQPRAIPFPRFWTHARLSWEMAIHPPDILFVPSHVVPLRHPTTVVTIHDLGYLIEPDSHPDAARRLLDWTTRWSARVSSQIIAISEVTKQLLVGAYQIAPDKIHVVYHGVLRQKDPVKADEVSRLRYLYRLPERYILTVGTIQPRKNLPLLVEAVARLRANGLPHRLVIVGRDGWLVERVSQAIEATGGSDLVHRLGYVAADHLPALYAEADLFAFPSLYEGFGLPLVEAIASGVPSVVSDRGALPEVAGDAALIADATDPLAWVKAMTCLIADQSTRSRLIDAGIKRAALFRWDVAGSQTLQVLHEALANRRR